MRSVAALALGKVGKSEIEKNCIIFFRETLSFEQTLMSMSAGAIRRHFQNGRSMRLRYVEVSSLLISFDR